MRDLWAWGWEPSWLLCSADDDDDGSSSSAGDDDDDGSSSSSSSNSSDSGKDTSGTDTSGTDTSGTGTSGTDTSGTDTSVTDTSGKDSPADGLSGGNFTETSGPGGGTGPGPGGGPGSEGGVSSDTASALDAVASGPAAGFSGGFGGVTSAQDALSGLDSPVEQALGLAADPSAMMASNMAVGPNITLDNPGDPSITLDNPNDLETVQSPFDATGLQNAPVEGLNSPFGAGPGMVSGVQSADALSSLDNLTSIGTMTAPGSLSTGAPATLAGGVVGGMTPGSALGGLNSPFGASPDAANPTLAANAAGFNAGLDQGLAPDPAWTNPANMNNDLGPLGTFPATGALADSVPLPTDRPATAPLAGGGNPGPGLDPSPGPGAVKVSDGSFNSLDAQAGPPASPGPSQVTGGPNPDASPSPISDTTAPSPDPGTSVPQGVADALAGADSTGSSTAPGFPLASQIVAPIPSGPPNPPPTAPDGGNFNVENGIYGAPTFAGDVSGPQIGGGGSQATPTSPDGSITVGNTDVVQTAGDGGNYNSESGIYDALNSAS